MSIQFQFNGSQVQFRGDFYNKFQFKENSPSIHCENSIKFFAIESHWHSKTLFTLLFCVPQSVKTKETNPTRPRSPTPCKQALNSSVIVM